MSAACYVARSLEIAARKFDGEMIIMSARDSTIFTLSEVATIIWEAADGSTPLDEIVATRISSQFEVAPEVALEDAEQLVQELASHGILMISDQPILALAKAGRALPRPGALLLPGPSVQRRTFTTDCKTLESLEK